jgi:membrane protein DedA with SNARE-associated domain
VPPVPSDAGVALGAFLSHRGLTSPPLVFLVTWSANLLGAYRRLLRGAAVRTPLVRDREPPADCSRPGASR